MTPLERRNRPLLRQDRWDEAAYWLKRAVPWVAFFLLALAVTRWVGG